MEPTTVVAKAWEQIDRINARASIGPERVLVTGAGPIGLLAALLAVQRGYEVHVLDRTTDGPKPQLVADLGATYHTDAGARGRAASRTSSSRPPARARSCSTRWPTTAANGIVCLTGISSGGRTDRARRGHAQPDDRAGERRGLRLGQREPPPLRGGGRGARPCRPRLARAADHPPRAAGPLARRAAARARTTSRSSSSSAPPEPGRCCLGSDGPRTQRTAARSTFRATFRRLGRPPESPGAEGRTT